MASTKLRIALACAIFAICLVLVLGKKKAGKKGKVEKGKVQKKKVVKKKSSMGAVMECVQLCLDNNGNEYERHDGGVGRECLSDRCYTVKLTRKCHYRKCPKNRKTLKECDRSKFRSGCLRRRS